MRMKLIPKHQNSNGKITVQNDENEFVSNSTLIDKDVKEKSQSDLSREEKAKDFLKKWYSNDTTRQKFNENAVYQKVNAVFDPETGELSDYFDNEYYKQNENQKEEDIKKEYTLDKTNAILDDNFETYTKMPRYIYNGNKGKYQNFVNQQFSDDDLLMGFFSRNAADDTNLHLSEIYTLKGDPIIAYRNPNDKDFDNIAVHEGTHALRTSDYLDAKISNILKEYSDSDKSDSDELKQYKEYMNDPHEIYSRLMELRFNLGLQPQDRNWTVESFKKFLDEKKERRNIFENSQLGIYKDGLIRLLNEVASNDSQQDVKNKLPETYYAKRGKKLLKKLCKKP